MICIGVADHTKCIISESLNVNELNEYYSKNKSFKNYKLNENDKCVQVDDFFKQECFLIVPAAKELVICGKEAENLNCKLIVEAANGPIDLEAENIILKKGITIIPDILANSGGVVVSYYEWLQNKRSEYWEEEDVLNKLKLRIRNTFKNAYLNKNTSLRISCYNLAINNIKQKIIRKNIY